MAIPTADEVHDHLSARLGPSLDELGLRRLRDVPYPAWRSAVDKSGQAIFLSWQVDAEATDPFAGGGFRIELENSKQQRPARGLNGRALFFQLMTVEELRILLAQQNRVIESLPKPPLEQVALYPEGPIRQQYLAYFQTQPSFDAVHSWLRYFTEADLTDWGTLLTPSLQLLVPRAAIHLTPDRRDLGRGYLLTAS